MEELVVLPLQAVRIDFWGEATVTCVHFFSEGYDRHKLMEANLEKSSRITSCKLTILSFCFLFHPSSSNWSHHNKMLLDEKGLWEQMSKHFFRTLCFLALLGISLAMAADYNTRITRDSFLHTRSEKGLKVTYFIRMFVAIRLWPWWFHSVLLR